MQEQVIDSLSKLQRNPILGIDNELKTNILRQKLSTPKMQKILFNKYR